MKKILIGQLLVLFLAACVGEDFVERERVFTERFSIVTTNEALIDTLLVQDSIIYMTTFINSEGNEADVDVTWTSSRSEVASIDNSGKVIALSEGATNIVAEANGLTSERLIIVQKFERIAITSTSTSLIVGDQLQFSSEYFNRMNVLTTANLTWTSSDPDVASIDNLGNLTALAFGNTTVMASFNGVVSNAITIDVVNIERVELALSDTILVVGESVNASAVYFDQTGTQATTSFTWSSSNTAVATIDNAGQIVGVSSGRSEITAVGNGITSNSLFVEVIDDTTIAVSMTISSPTTSVNAGENLQFSAEVRNINGKILPNEPVIWNSSDPAVLSIDANGLAAGITPGTSDVSASSGNITSNINSVLVNPMVAAPRMGSFSGVGTYSVNGTVTMSVLPNGNLKLDFAGFSSSSGPGLYIYLSNTTNGGITIEPLSGRSGNFTVNLPANISINDYNNVLIWCQPFGLTFGFAALN